MSEKAEHRRKYPRIPSQNTVLVKQLGGHESEGFAKTQIVGLGGCMFISKQAFGSGSYLDVLIAIHHTIVKALCKVAYEKPLEDSKFEVGLEFVQMTDTDRRLIETLWSNPSDARQGDSF